ncbi:MAG: hypothetical protein BRD46_03165, partial [Bacteroidetes bacterium QS_8_68_15]
MRECGFPAAPYEGEASQTRDLPRTRRNAETPAPCKSGFSNDPLLPRRSSMKRLVVVESPTKADTIRNYLSGDGHTYQIEASMGHVRDLPASA